MKLHHHARVSLLACLTLLTGLAPRLGTQETGDFANAEPIIINTPRQPGPDGTAVPLAATPYPSTINVSGFPAGETVGKVTVTLHELAHQASGDLDILLVGPEGQSILILSDVGDGFFGGGGGLPEPEPLVTVTLDDDAEERLSPYEPLVSGRFKPSNFGGEDVEDPEPDVFPEPVDENDVPTGPAPVPSPATSLSVFAGTRPNGDWRLYVVDDEVFDAGSIVGGWSLTIRPAASSGARFRRGDANQDGEHNLTDAVFTLTALFLGGAQPTCADAADADDDGFVTLADAVYTLDHLFRGGPAPPAPGLETCGPDRTEDGATCESPPPCPAGCPEGVPECGGVCTNFAFDPQNCGACGVVCPPDTTCSGGVCAPVDPCGDCGF